MTELRELGRCIARSIGTHDPVKTMHLIVYWFTTFFMYEFFTIISIIILECCRTQELDSLKKDAEVQDLAESEQWAHRLKFSVIWSIIYNGGPNTFISNWPHKLF